jgi:hypothetical protein
MIKRLPLIACAAYLLAAFPTFAQDASLHDSCGGDSCASDAYDLGYHDGYEGHSYTSLTSLQNNPQYEAGFSEGEMDGMAEQDPLTQVDGRLSTATDEADSLTSRSAAEEENKKAPRAWVSALDEGAEDALIRRYAKEQALDPRQPLDGQTLDRKTNSLYCQFESLDCESDMLDRQTDSLNGAHDLTPNRILSVETDGFDQIRAP